MEQLQIFSREYTIRTNDYDAFNHLSMEAVLDLLQNGAARHAALLKASRSDLEKLDLYWVIVRTEVEVISAPKLLSKVILKTWPLKPTRLYFDRMYQIFDETGENMLIKARSRWVLVDAATRKFGAPGLYEYPLSSFHEEVLFSDSFERFPLGEEVVGEHVVRPSEIDENHHFNNSKYASVVYDYLDLDAKKTIKNFAINYSHELMLGEKITILRSLKDEQLFVAGKKGDILIFSSAVKVG